MNVRVRFLAALVALSALVLFQVEGLWASSACSMEMGVAMSAPSATADGGSHLDPCPMDQPGHTHDQDGSGSHCPLAPAGAASCAGSSVAVLPSASVPSLSVVADELSTASSDHAKDLLLAVSLLRPPRA